MKSEERHQLMANDLEAVTKKVAGTVEQHTATAIAVVAGIVLAVGIGYWWSSTSESDSAAAWTLLDTAQNLESFGDVADRYKGKPPGQWALLISSERTLQTAMPLMFTNRELAMADVAKSREGFEALLQESKLASAIRERALWGLALCLETSCDGQIAKPMKAYENLLLEFPETMFKTVAEERLAALKTKDAADFYAWFSKENPEPPEARPRDGVILPSPGAPGKPKTPGDDLDEFIPKKEEMDKAPPASESKDAAPADKPQTDKPADTEKPAGPESPNNSEKPGEKN